MDTLRDGMKYNCSFLLRGLFKFLGLNASPTKNIAYKIYSVYMMSILVIYPWGNLHVLIKNLDDYDIVINSLFNVIGGYAATFKLIFMVYKRKKFFEVFNKIEEFQKRYNTEKWSQMRTYRTSKKLVVAIVFFYLSLLYFYVSTITERITNSDNPSAWKLPISDVATINRTYSPNYEIAWIYQSSAVTIASSVFCMTDFLVAALLVDLTTQYKILRKHMQRTFHELAVTDDPTSLSWSHLRRLIKQCVTYHLSILKLTTDVEEICSTMVFIGVLAGLSVTSFSIYYASVLPPLDFRALQSYLEAGMIILALFFLCYCGTELSEASLALASACYETNFVGTDVRFQKSLMFIIMRSQRPISITVGKFVGLSIGIFTFIMRSIYTYFMVLRKSKTGDNI